MKALKSQNISDETKLLIRHYLELVEHRIMKQDELSHLANKIYQKHKLALDFIFENRADNVAVVSNELSSWVESDLRSIGFSPAYSTKSFVRFQSPDMERLSEILPGNGWGNSELIVWEFNIRQDRIDLKVTLGPCEDADARSQVRDVLNSALKGKSKSKSYSSYLRKRVFYGNIDEADIGELISEVKEKAMEHLEANKLALEVVLGEIVRDYS